MLCRPPPAGQVRRSDPPGLRTPYPEFSVVFYLVGFLGEKQPLQLVFFRTSVIAYASTVSAEAPFRGFRVLMNFCNSKG